MTTKQAVRSLSTFVRRFTRDKASDKPLFRAWCKEHEKDMERWFRYKREEGMPSITSLVSASFHPTEQLVMLNYTAGAHNTLHKFHAGWTKPLRQCRGIVFEMISGELIAKPFEKFFNYGEHPETTNLPSGPFEATLKHDGHLGIIFQYRGKFFITTRGEFTSPTAIFAQRMLDDYVKKHKWNYFSFLPITLLVEIIHSRTKVFVEYGGRECFILLSAYDFMGYEYNRSSLEHVSIVSGIEIVERRSFSSIEELLALTKGPSLTNIEGFVATFENGSRVKFKTTWIINQMVEKKLSYKYLMQRMISGNLNRMIENLPEEVYAHADEMLRELKEILKNTKFSEKEKRKRLYGLVSVEESTQYYRTICRNFLAHHSTAVPVS